MVMTIINDTMTVKITVKIDSFGINVITKFLECISLSILPEKVDSPIGFVLIVKSVLLKLYFSRRLSAIALIGINAPKKQSFKSNTLWA